MPQPSQPDPSPPYPINNALNGELDLILLVNQDTIFSILPGLLVNLSRHLQASVRTKLDEDGRPIINRWRSDSGIGELIEMPESYEANASDVYVMGKRVEHAIAETGKITMRKRRESMNSELSQSPEKEALLEGVLKGVRIILVIDVSMCHSIHNITSLGRVFSCFSQIENVPAYLAAAANTKKV